MLFVILSSFFLLNIFDKRIKNVIAPFLDNEVERFTTVLVNDAFNELELEKKMTNIFHVDYDNYGHFEKISYQTSLINQFSSELSHIIENRLKKIEMGEYDSSFFSRKIQNGKYQHIRNGILCEISIGSLRGSTLFANIGPVIPIRLLYLGQMNPDVDVKVREYGLNNMVLEIDYVATIKEQITMPFSSKQKEIVIRQPLVIDIIRGEIPNSYHSISK